MLKYFVIIATGVLILTSQSYANSVFQPLVGSYQIIDVIENCRINSNTSCPAISDLVVIQSTQTTADLVIYSKNHLKKFGLHMTEYNENLGEGNFRQASFQYAKGIFYWGQSHTGSFCTLKISPSAPGLFTLENNCETSAPFRLVLRK